MNIKYLRSRNHQPLGRSCIPTYLDVPKSADLDNEITLQYKHIDISDFKVVFFQQIDDCVIDYVLNNQPLIDLSFHYPVIFSASGSRYTELFSKYHNITILECKENSYYEKWWKFVEYSKTLDYDVAIRTCVDSFIVDPLVLLKMVKFNSTKYDFFGNRDIKTKKEILWIRGGCSIYKKYIIDKFKENVSTIPIAGYDQWIYNNIHDEKISIGAINLFEYGDKYLGKLPVWHPMTKDLPHKEYSKIYPYDSYRPLPFLSEDKINNDSDFIVLTSYFNYACDSQRNKIWPSTFKDISKLANSVLKFNGDIYIFHNSLDDIPTSEKIHSIKCDPILDYPPVLFRWIVYQDFLNTFDTDKWIVLSDSTDVEMIRAIYNLDPDKFSICADNKLIDNTWLSTHQEPLVILEDYHDIIYQNKKQNMLNAGVIIAKIDLIKEYLEILCNYIRIHKGITTTIDMALCNYTFFKHFKNKIQYGPNITTEFKKYEYTDQAIFRHK